MGTRNITRVILDGKVKVNQYCQWDGYPTGRGAEVLEFMRDVIKGGSLDVFKDAVASSELVKTTEEDAFYTGAPVKNDVWSKAEKLFPYGPDYTQVCDAIRKNELTVEEAKYLIVASRDNGNSVLKFLLRYATGGMTFYTTDYLSGITDMLDWQIEGMFTINLDERYVDVDWHGVVERVTFDSLVEMTSETIERVMNHLERGTEDE